jgi:2-iminobutanoate/2-iminopropanoate deaminase
MRNIEAVLRSLGLGMADIVKCTVFLADIDDWAAMNVEYLRFFPGPKPARSALGSSGLALGARVEIECVAARP